MVLGAGLPADRTSPAPRLGGEAAAAILDPRPTRPPRQVGEPLPPTGRVTRLKKSPKVFSSSIQA